MKYLCALCILGVLCVSCKDDESYADQKKKERKAIAAFLERDPLILLDAEGDTLLHTGKINPISQEQFEAQDSMTDVSKNEYVLFKQTGIYMQIVRKGPGEKLKHGENKQIICRYYEYSIMGDSLHSTDRTSYWAPSPEILNVSNNSGTISASFDSDANGAMNVIYGTTSKSTTVPTGWIVPMSYINLGRQKSDDEGIALVRVIVPHSQGTAAATSSVLPYFYEISYQEKRN